ncbi:MAG TPA: hypothetical protein VK590_10950, partial [Saprospiraceae bacterium]|nr:hypothetical protein [Saprospiraceae bacterium]
MVGVSRATFYKHIETRGISTVKDLGGQPKVDVSELIRIYGDRVKAPEKKEGQGASNSNEERQEGRSIKDNLLVTELEV